MSDDLKRLRDFTEGCRDDMHEPDNQGLKARVVGDHLDNAMGDQIHVDLITRGAQEFVVVLSRDGYIECFNLATLIALARRP